MVEFLKTVAFWIGLWSLAIILSPLGLLYIVIGAFAYNMLMSKFGYHPFPTYQNRA